MDQDRLRKLAESTRIDLASGAFARAAQDLAELAKARGGDLATWHNLAVARYRNGDFDGALAALGEAVQLAPQDADTHYLHGLVLLDQGEARGALAAFDRAIRVRPDHARALYHRGLTRLELDHAEGAAEDLAHAARLLPDELLVSYNLGVAQVACRDWARARESFARCLDLDPAGRPRYLDLLVQTGQAEAAEMHYHHGHRLKNLLGLIGAQLGAALTELPDGPARSAVVEAHQRHERLYEDMVAFLGTLRHRPSRIELVSVRDVIERCLFVTASRLGGYTVVTRFDPDLPELVCHAEQVQEAVLNLLLNAAEAMEAMDAMDAMDASTGGGRLAIQVTRVDALHLAILVADTGRGVEGPTERIFRFGYTTKPYGSGLGLHQVERTAQAHGGLVALDTQSGEGCCLALVLPLVMDAPVSIEHLAPRLSLLEDPAELVREMAHA